MEETGMFGYHYPPQRRWTGPSIEWAEGVTEEQKVAYYKEHYPNFEFVVDSFLPKEGPSPSKEDADKLTDRFVDIAKLHIGIKPEDIIVTDSDYEIPAIGAEKENWRPRVEAAIEYNICPADFGESIFPKKDKDER